MPTKRTITTFRGEQRGKYSSPFVLGSIGCFESSRSIKLSSSILDRIKQTYVEANPLGNKSFTLPLFFCDDPDEPAREKDKGAFSFSFGLPKVALQMVRMALSGDPSTTLKFVPLSFRQPAEHRWRKRTDSSTVVYLRIVSVWNVVRHLVTHETALDRGWVH